VELLVIVSALGIWCFDNWTDSVQWAVRSLRPAVEALMVSFRDRADSFRMGLESMVDRAEGPWLGKLPDPAWTSPYHFHSLNSEVETPSQEALRNSA
jgi:hypothetical protein